MFTSLALSVQFSGQSAAGTLYFPSFVFRTTWSFKLEIGLLQYFGHRLTMLVKPRT